MALRIEKAKIMGYKSPAHYILEPKMAHDPETVDAFLSAIMKQAVVRAKAEIADMQQEMNADIKAGLLPAGSTIQGVRVLEEKGLRGAVMDAVIASYNKTKEMGKG